ncbi:hypothetical protein P171DRAFT_91693 [Karstenula rhodostoma CBS 690.94]|uniref:Uncharacterized protein n=1 Tax=Karstenula rhodostoma CBS 690.94 TaxID=1392251 RepID=A0A9P4PDI8_9PLEO|nr:hypothetical protein P171DRAFT_91693 [Karstenula rhodostoma CBS 690.94]
MPPPRTRPRPMNALQTRGNALLSKQLASISATLANASKRRDTAAKEVASRGTSRSSTPMPSTRSPPARPLVDHPSSSLTPPLVDYPPSSPLICGSSVVVNDAFSDHDGLATTGGAQAATAVENGAAEDQKNASSDSIPVSRLSSRDVGYGNGDVASMMWELEEMSGASNTPVQPLGKGEIEDLESLRDRLEKMLGPSPIRPTASAGAKMQAAAPFAVSPTLQRIKNNQKSDLDISQKTLFYATALQLEKTGIKWELAQGWTTYLFSVGSRGHVAVRQKYQFVEEAKTELDILIKQVLDEEAAYWANQEKNTLPCRLLLSNIAASADSEEVASFLSEFRYDIRNIKMLARDPISRTQTALVDMYTKNAAKQASYIMGSIFGLVVKINLATEGD